MTYNKQLWTNGAAGGTPLSASRFNYMEDGIQAAAAVADLAIPAAQKGVANGVASLDSNGLVPAAQVPIPVIPAACKASQTSYAQTTTDDPELILTLPVGRYRIEMLLLVANGTAGSAFNVRFGGTAAFGANSRLVQTQAGNAGYAPLSNQVVNGTLLTLSPAVTGTPAPPTPTSQASGMVAQAYLDVTTAGTVRLGFQANNGTAYLMPGSSVRAVALP